MHEEEGTSHTCDLSEGKQADHLEASTVGQQVSVPVHVLVQSAEG